MKIEHIILTPEQRSRLEAGRTVKGAIRINPFTKEIEFKAYNYSYLYPKRQELHLPHSRTIVGSRGMSFRFYFLKDEAAKMNEVLQAESKQAGDYAAWVYGLPRKGGEGWPLA